MRKGGTSRQTQECPLRCGVRRARRYRASDLTLAVNRCHAAVLTVSTGPLRSVVSLIAITAGP